MALVFKIHHNGTLRRWVVSQIVPDNSLAFTVTVDQLKSKIRELFHLSEDTQYLITYVDKDGDVITLADDQDLVDACLVQHLNPFRLELHIVEGRHISKGTESSFTCDDLSSSPSGKAKFSTKPFLPQVTAESIKQFLAKYTQAIDPNIQPAVLLRNIHQAMRDFVKNVVHEGQRLVPRGGPLAYGSSGFTRCGSEPPVRPPAFRNYSNEDAALSAVHLGVTCDECGAYPIQGVRYKSTTIFNYDLCSSCHQEAGNKSDYQKIDRPVRSHWHGFNHSTSSEGFKLLTKWESPFASGVDGWKSECPFLQLQLGGSNCISEKFDASIVKDWIVFDGSELAPGMQFIKMWRFKNSGSVPWPQGTQLVNIGGHKLTVEKPVCLKLPEGGLPTGLEFELSVGMQAPDIAGKYVSHWSLMAPGGERFGKSVWVAVNVSSQGHACATADTKAAAAVEEGGIVDEIVDIRSENKQEECLDASIVSTPTTADVKSLPDLNLSTVEMDEEESTEVDGFSMIEKPAESESSKMLSTSLLNAALAYRPEPTSILEEQVGQRSDSEIVALELHMHRLETMGFADRDLNALLLVKNNQDLQCTLDDLLLLGSGWGGLLKDLQDMGFNDTATNLCLLIKNEGSIKRVVKDLVELEKH